MLKSIIISSLFIFVLAVLYALSNKLVGREDTVHTCGMDHSCDKCAIKAQSEKDCPPECKPDKKD